jgi:nucleoporin p58/p45
LQFGQSNSQQQQTVPGVRIDTANIRGTTRFNDLHDELQKQIDHLDAVIQQQIKIKNDINAILPAHDNGLANIPNDVEFCRRKLIGLDAAMSSDIESIGNVQKLVTKDIEHAKLSFRAADNLRLPAQYHIPGVWPSKSSTNDNRSQNGNGEAQQDIVGYFSSTADELSATLTKYQKNVNEIELHLRNVESTSAQQVASLVARRNGGSASDDDAIRELAAALVEFEQGILHVAGKVGGARESVQTLQLNQFTGPSDANATNGKRSSIY